MRCPRVIYTLDLPFPSMSLISWFYYCVCLSSDIYLFICLERPREYYDCWIACLSQLLVSLITMLFYGSSRI